MEGKRRTIMKARRGPGRRKKTSRKERCCFWTPRKPTTLHEDSVLFVSLFFYSWSTFPASPRHRLNDGSGQKYVRVEEGFQEGVGETTKQIDASGAVDAPFSWPVNYREAPQSVDKNCDAYPCSSPKAIQSESYALAPYLLPLRQHRQPGIPCSTHTRRVVQVLKRLIASIPCIQAIFATILGRRRCTVQQTQAAFVSPVE